MAKDNKEGNKKKIFYIAGTAIVVLVITAGIYFYSINKAVDSWKNRIYPNISIHGVNIGGKTKEEAKELINLEVVDKVSDKNVILESKGEKIVINYKEINPEYKVDEAINKALAYGKDEGIFAQNSYIKRGMNAEIDVEFGYDEKKVEEYKESLQEKVNTDAKDATIECNADKINIVPGVNGEIVDTKKLDDLIDENLNGDIENMDVVIKVPTIAKEPAITEKMLGDIDSKIGSSTTSYNQGDWSRSTNLKVASDNINGTIVMPGETFSYNEVVGERTVERGFREGAAFEGGRVVPSIGGGVCQISTTLYQAVTRAGILPTERYNHTMTVSYANVGEDATVAWGYLDYKFKNTYDSPIYIQASAENGVVTFNVYGDEDDLNGYTYGLVGVKTGSINPGSKRINDASLPEGTQIVETRPSPGATATGYFVTYKDGKEIERKEISRDTYNSTEGVIRYGVG